MLCKLYEAMDLLPQLISKREVWDSLIVNRRKPYTYRVFTTLPNGLRLCLHKFDPCHRAPFNFPETVRKFDLDFTPIPMKNE